MNDIKTTLDEDLVKAAYSVQWNDSLVTLEELTSTVPAVR